MSFLFGALILALDIWAILNLFKSRATDGAKVLWTLGILLFPIAGLLAWGVAGPKPNKQIPRF